jgi:ectoine hydroxylase-related dioxygenase (phytanoyl-CoA dioxygenase family)
MNRDPLRNVTAEERQDFLNDGAVCLRGLFDPDWVELLRGATEEIMAHPTELSLDHEAKTGKFFSAIYVWRENAEFRSFEFESPLGRVCAELMGSETGRIYHDHLLVKEPGTDAPTPWHQDQPYFLVNGSQLCSLWFALDPVTVHSGGVKFIKGSHRWGWFDPNIFKPGQEETDEFPPAPDIENRIEELEVLSWDLEPGDCTVHHGLTFHGASPNESAERRRRGHSVRIAGDDTTFATRKKAHALPFDPGLQPGQKLASELFPQVWPAFAA